MEIEDEVDDSMEDHIFGRNKSSLTDRCSGKDDSRVIVREVSESVFPGTVRILGKDASKRVRIVP